MWDLDILEQCIDKETDSHFVLSGGGCKQRSVNVKIAKMTVAVTGKNTEH